MKENEKALGVEDFRKLSFEERMVISNGFYLSEIKKLELSGRNTPMEMFMISTRHPWAAESNLVQPKA